MAIKQNVIRSGSKILGSLPSGDGDPLLTLDSTSKEVGKVPPVDTSTFLSTTLTSGYLLIGNSSNLATPQQVSGMLTISNTGIANITNNSIQNDHINAAAAIAYSKLNLTDSIENNDISTTAAIARSKIAAGNAYRVLINNGSGVFTEASAITGSRLLVSDSNGIPTASGVSATEAANLVGTTSAIQDQLNNRLLFSNAITPIEGDMIYYTGGSWTRFPKGTSGQYLTSTVSGIQWTTTPNGVPTGGSAGQYLNKVDGTDYNTQWSTLTLSKITDVTASAAQVNVLATGYYDATSSIQTQLNNKLSTALTYNCIFVGSVGNLAVPLSPGTNGQILTIVSGAPQWQTVIGTGSVTSVNVSGGATGLSTTGGPVTTSGTITLTGTLNPVSGGTGLTSYNTGDIIYASASNVLSKLAAGTNGYILTLIGGVPSWQPNSGGGGGGTFVTLPDGPGVFTGQALKGVRVNAGETSLEYVTLANGTVTSVGGTLNRITVTNPTTTPIIDIDANYVGQSSITTLGTIITGTWNASAIAAGYGGTGQTTVTTGDLLCGSVSNTWSKLAGVATGNVLISGGVSTAPSWGKVTSAHVDDTVWKVGGNTLSGAAILGSSSNQDITLQTGTANLFFDTATNRRFTIKSDGLIFVGVDGTGGYSSSTEKFVVNFVGLGSGSTINALSVKNNTNNFFRVTTDGRTIFGNNTAGACGIWQGTNNLTTPSPSTASQTGLVYSAETGATIGTLHYFRNAANQANTTGDGYGLRTAFNWDPTSGTGNFTHISIEGQINQTLSASGVYRMLDFNLQELSSTGTLYGITVRSTTAKNGIGTSTPTALLDIAGSSTARASLRVRSGTAPTSPSDGDIWYTGSNLFLNSSSVSYTVPKVLTASAVLDFPSTAAGSYSDLTISITGAADGDPLYVGIPNAAVLTTPHAWEYWVSSANTVTIRFWNLDLISADPGSGTFKVVLHKI